MSQKHTQKKSSPDKPVQHQVDCYVKCLRLKESQEYREASQEIRRLQERVREADDRFMAARDAYLPYLDPRVHDSAEKQISRQEYLAAEESAEKMEEALSLKKGETCKKFGLVQWWDPDDLITIKDATDIFSPSLSVVVLDPAPDKRVDWYTKVRKEAQRALASEGVWLEPPRRYTKADKEGWLTLKVNLNAPLEESEPAISRLLRVNRVNTPKTRNRPDKVAAALETFVCYEQMKQFSAVAKHLQRSINTVKGQYVRAFVLIHGQPPTGSIKQRRVGIVRDPAGDFQAHLGSCSRCQKDTVKEWCPKWKAYVTQDTKALREPLITSPMQ